MKLSDDGDWSDPEDRRNSTSQTIKPLTGASGHYKTLIHIFPSIKYAGVCTENQRVLCLLTIP